MDRDISPMKVYFAGAMTALAIAYGTTVYCKHMAEETRKIKEDLTRWTLLEQTEAKRLDSLVRAD